MNNIKLLDCTLRDGGYINNWNFGYRTIKKVIEKLSQSNIDIIECGFIRDQEFNHNRSVFNDVESIKEFINPKHKNIFYVGMIDYPYIPIDKINNCDGSSIDGIRLTFHENEIEEAMDYGEKLIRKGYKVFIQPVGTTSYNDSNLIKLVQMVNKLNPYAFYLVDTLGVMYKNDLLRMYHLIDNNLNDSISIGFHSHNNLQLSFSNAQELLMLHTKRKLIIDASVFGMGRGAGNLCTELVTQYINNNIEEKYNVVPLLEIVDEHLGEFSYESKWGYSLPYYISAVNNTHPNYASYLINKQTISVKSINTILKLIPLSKKDIFDPILIEDLYINYQHHFVDDTENIEIINNLIGNRKVLIIAPGKTIKTELEKIRTFIHSNDPFVICVNFLPETLNTNAIFISNEKRFNSLSEFMGEKNNNNISLITTSNIPTTNDYFSFVINYSDLLIDNSLISDNSGLMLLNLLNRLSINNVYLAGFDGFHINKMNNYFSNEMINSSTIEELIKKNDAIRKHLNFIERKMNIHFITSSIYSDSHIYSPIL
ncbi:aldolase catalytic domain-containing protein [Lederbergia citri]|uniref:Aldolase catalytic domain-containing protein n=1 Tax=Lederbergia citri TaxID=2833580 RepID=A0A942TIE0_9BACI|nr:aldolase catalytic domain-containing protein [Lederbergia citri]MBS4197593.1 aldolase catalytic domain-containing protein [Lederbergia citri]